MSMRYKDIIIPREAREEFEAFVSEKGGKLLKPVPTRELVDMWREQTQQAKILLDATGAPHDLLTEEAIQKNIEELMKDSFVEGYFDPVDRKRKQRQLSFKGNIDWSSVKEELVKYFRTCISDERAHFFHVSVPHGEPVLSRNRTDRYITPRQIAMVIQAYGLDNGHPVSSEALHAQYHFASSSVRVSELDQIRTTINRNQELAELVLDPPFKL